MNISFNETGVSKQFSGGSLQGSGLVAKGSPSMGSGRRGGYSLVELLVAVAIIGVLLAVLLPALARSRAAANAAAAAAHLKAFGAGFALHAADDAAGRYSTGAFDHLLDGDVRSRGWVADLVRLKVTMPDKARDPGNRWRVSETVADYTGAARLGVAPVVDGSDNGWTTTSYTAVTGTTFFGNPAELDEVWMAGFNSTFATTWQFSRGDPSTTLQPGSAAAAGGGSPTQGTGPLDTTTLSRALTTAARIALMGPARASDGPNFTVRSATRRLRSGIADARINDFMGFRLVKPADLVLESFTDGMTVDASGVPGIEPGERLIHDFSDIEPLHMARGDGTGGFAPVLFADGNVARVHDVATVGGSAGRGDGYLGNRDARDASGAVTSTAIDAAGYNEVADDLWPKRLRAADASSGSVIR